MSERTTLRRVYFGVEIISRQVAEPDSETDGWLHEIGGTEFKTLALAINHARGIDEAKRKAGE